MVCDSSRVALKNPQLPSKGLDSSDLSMAKDQTVRVLPNIHGSSSLQEPFSDPAFQKSAPQIHGQRQQDQQPLRWWLPQPRMARTDQGGQHQIQNDFGSCCAFHQRGPKNVLGRLGEGDLDQSVATDITDMHK